MKQNKQTNKLKEKQAGDDTGQWLQLFINYSKKERTCCRSRASSAAAGSRLTMGLFLICLARSAYLSVFKVSSKLLSAGLTQAIIKVLLLPPRESVKRKKNTFGVISVCFLCALLTKLVRSRLLDIGQVIFLHFYGPRRSRDP